MIDFHGQADMEASADRYFAGRAGYYEAARDLVSAIPQAASWRPDDVLEVGAYTLPLVQGCHTLDNRTWPTFEPTYLHDACQTPWPIPDRRYRLVVALQVFEHLGDRQPQAFAECARIADWAVISVPYRWPRPPDHADIDEATLARWFGVRPLFAQLVRSSIAPLDRLVCLYPFQHAA